MPCLFPNHFKLDESSAIVVLREHNIIVSSWLRTIYCVNMEQLPEHIAQAVNALVNLGYSRINLTMTQSSEPGYVWSSQTDS